MKLRIIATITFLSLTIIGAISGTLAVILSIAFPLSSFLAGFLILEAILLYAVFDHRAPVFGKIFWRGRRDIPAVAITFDDGPNEPFTSQVLDILRNQNVKATFFILGENALSYPEPLKREVMEGHEIGNHTYNHGVLPLKSPSFIRDQIERTSDLIEKLTGIRPKLFRAPHGWRNPWMDHTVRKTGCTHIAWTLGVWDTSRPGSEVIVRRTMKGIGNGCILLLHDGRGTEIGTDSSQLVRALPILIREIRRAGFRFLTVSELMKEAGDK